MRRWQDRMLKTRMFIAFSIVALFIVGSTCFMFYVKNTNDVQNQTLSLSKIISKQFSEMINLYMQNIEELSLAISIDPVIQSNLFHYYKTENEIEKETIGYKLNPVLFNFSYPKAYVQGISVYTLDGSGYDYTKLVTSDPVVSFSKEQLEHVHDVLKTAPFLLMPSQQMDKPDGGQPEKVVSFIRKITKIPTQSIIGFVSISIDVNAFKLVLESSQTQDIENLMLAMIVDDQGQVIFEKGKPVQNAALSVMDTSLFRQPGREGEMSLGGDKYLYTYEKSEYTGWYTVVLIPKEAIAVKQKRMQTIVIFVGVITMLLIAAVSYFLSHQIMLPLNHLMRKMSRVEIGDFTTRMEYEGKNEIGRLSRMFNLMLDSISRLIREVYESKLAEKNAQLSALHAQINPHFLYNTLNIMKSISRLRGIEEVAEISEALAGLFQYSMKNLHQPVTLQEEIDHIHNYFKIQQHRFGDRLELHCQIPSELLRASLLKLTIQPLVENAVNHGLRRKKSGGRITIHTVVRDESLIVEVRDNGDGIKEDALERLRTALDRSASHNQPQDAAHGIGLLNIHERVTLFYGKPYGLRLTSAPGEGTAVTVAFPYLANKREDGEQAQ